MKRRCIGLVVLILSACTAPSSDRAGSVNHVVLAWFKASVTPDEIAEIRERTLALREIPGIRSLRVGAAVPSRRPMVDDSFDLGVVMEFDSAADMRAYLAHPEHKAFIDRYVKGRVDRLLIYDIGSDPR